MDQRKGQAAGGGLVMYEELMDYIMAYQDILTMANRVIEIWKKEYLKVSNELEQVKAERDAAIKDMKNNNKCSICLFRQVPSNKCPYYNKCGLTYEYFQWRGPQD